jgi:RNA polymerase sigma-70 factor, ECF subfamily
MGASAAAAPALKRKVYDSAEELELVHRAKAGDEGAFTALYAHHFNRLRIVISRIVHDEDQAEWLANVSLTKVWQKLGSFDEQSKFSTWVTRIAINEGLQHLRHENTQACRNEVSLDQELDQSGNGHSRGRDARKVSLKLGVRDLNLEGVADREVLRRAITRVPTAYRDILRLRFWEGMRNKDIRRVLGNIHRKKDGTATLIPMAALKSRLLRGRKILIQQIHEGSGRSCRA